MAIVKILNNSINPLGWKVGDHVEISEEQGLNDLIERKMVELISAPEEKLSSVEEPKSSQFKCEICGKEFKVKLGLIGHGRSHKLKGVN